MCTRYISPDTAAIERHWHVGRDNAWRGGELFPRSPGVFIRAARHSAEPERELVVGQWGLIPWFAKEARLGYPTVNARFEEIMSKPSYKDPWRYGKRCIIPAWSFDEPNWGSGRNVWWRFRRMDGTPWGLAGLWNTWTDKTTGESIDSYTMLTINADAPVDAAHAQARPEARAGSAGQTQRGGGRARRRRSVALRASGGGGQARETDSRGHDGGGTRRATAAGLF